VSVVATLMGFANADFVVRECRAMAAGGPIAILRLGTCGGVAPDAVPGTVMLATASVCVRRNPDAAAAPLGGGAGAGGAGAGGAPPPPLLRAPAAGGPTHVATPELPYDVSGAVPAHGGLSALYGAHLQRQLAAPRAPGARAFALREGLDASADTFYASQGREGAGWDDRNEALLPLLERVGVACMQMETFHIFDLCRAAAAPNGLLAAAAAIVLVNRTAEGAAPVSGEDVAWLEAAGGRAALDTLAEFKI
jgi:uridine phosphorylase